MDTDGLGKVRRQSPMRSGIISLEPGGNMIAGSHRVGSSSAEDVSGCRCTSTYREAVKKLAALQQTANHLKKCLCNRVFIRASCFKHVLV